MRSMTASLAIVWAKSNGPGPDPLAPLAGRSLLQHALMAVAGARMVSDVVVVTDRDDIAAAATAFGAAPLLADLKATERADADAVVVTGVCWPLLRADDVDGVLARLTRDQADSVVAVTAPARMTWRGDPAGAWAEPAAGEACYAETGALYAASGTRFGERPLADFRRPVFGRTALHPLPGERALPVTLPGGEATVCSLPWALAEAALVERARGGRRARLPLRPAALVMDFDGVFTDNRVTVDEGGREAVTCNRSDGLGLEQLRALGLPMLVLSKERNPVVQARCAKLKLECLQAVDDKRPALEAWCGERGLDLADVIYIGNDTNDLPCFAAVGCAVAVADAHVEALRAARIILASEGGRGALRELADMIAERLRKAP